MTKSKKFQKLGPNGMPPACTIEIGTQIILIQIDGFLQKRLELLSITSFKGSFVNFEFLDGPVL